jgi:Tol biopolymer transport system component/DNA-binding winged helix-turn-helix (wHTH) protein
MIVSLKHPSRSLFQFGGFTLDLRRHGLYRGEERIHLTEKPLKTLTYLVENRGRVVEKQELLDEIWKDTFVTEDNLVHAISEIRRALADDKDDPRFVQTVPRHGYRFVGDVVVASHAGEISQEGTSTSKITGREGPHRAERLPGPIRKTRNGQVIVISVLAIILTGSLVGLYVFIYRRPQIANSATVFQKLKVTRLSTSGKVTSAVVSPDGRYVVYAQSDEAKESLWLKQIESTSNVQIMAPAPVFYKDLTFSPDGNHLYYVARDANQLGMLYQIPALGGLARELFRDVDSGITFSPDGKRLAFFRGYPEKRETVLVVANTDGSAEQIASSQKAPQFFPTRMNGSPAWSPDGAVIACPIQNADVDGPYMTVTTANAADGEIRSVTPRRWSEVGHLVWLHNGSGLIITAKDRPSSPFQIWYLSVPSGEARQITNDLNSYVGLSLSRSATGSLVAIQSDARSSVVIGADDIASIEIAVSSVEGVAGISWTPDGRIVYAARISDNHDLWIMTKDGRNPKQLTAAAGDNNWPSVTPDGQYIVFMSDRTGTRHIWRMNIDGTNAQQLTSNSDERWPSCSPDGKWVVYASMTNPLGLFKVSIEGGAPVRLTNKRSAYPAISPNGSLIATGYFEAPGANKTAIYSFQGGDPLEILDFFSFHVSWTPDGRSLTYIDQRGVSNITSRPIDGRSSTKQLTHFSDGVVVAFDWSRDGELVCSHKVVTSDAVMLTDLR